MKPKWVMVERGKRWRYCLGEKTLGVVYWNFSGWEAKLCFDKKWPKDSKSVWYHSASGGHTCWEARRAVEAALEDLEEEKRLQSEATTR